MNVIKYPQKGEWDELLKRPVMNVDTLRETVCRVLDDVKTGGDRTVMAYEKQFDHVELERLAVTEEEMDEAERLVSPELKDALRLAHDNIGKFHASQRFETTKVEVRPGVTCWQKAVPIERVGLYIPGGTAPLFSTVLMLATPAKIAGCREIVLCTPPGRDGKVHPAILCAARVAGVNRIFKAGGVQAIGAMAYGTESVPKVYKIFGPGNQYVMAAKQQVSLHDVAIDMPAGPSEVEVLADVGSNPVFVAADLLSQAEHGVDSQVLLVTTDEALVGKVQDEVERQLAALPRKEIAEQALAHSKLVVVRDMDEALELTNRYAPEHLIIETADYMQAAERVVNAGSVFLGSYTPESAGDYASGTNHTLPTNGYATAYSGVNLDSYHRKITFQELTPQGVRAIGPAVELMAAGEHLDAHRNAMAVRLESIKTEMK
ncbi:histidinol dehydrogenase [Paraprevotella clara]|uniref:histidinol dehydrogenase n=1 Tax=Paraprevotella clara TaxID=454154 RepID=UPI0040260494